MGKFSGIVFGTTAAMLISYYILASYYSPVINWLSPDFGSGLALILGIGFLLLGDPFIYPVVIFVWVAIGAVVGLSVRRVKGCIVSMIFVHAACWLILLIGIAGAVLGLLPSGGGIFPGSSTGGTSLSAPSFPTIPIPPSGTNILTIFSEPVIAQVFHTLLSLFPKFSSSGTASTSPSSGLGSILTTFAVPALVAIIFLFTVSVLAAGLVAHYTRKFILRLDAPRRTESPGITGHVLTILALLLAVSLMISGASAGIFSVSGSNGVNLPAHAVIKYSVVEGAMPASLALGKFAEMSEVINKLSYNPALRESADGHTAGTSSVSSQGVYDEAAVNLISSDGNLYSGYIFVSNYSQPQNSVTGNSQVGASLLLMTQNLVNFPFQTLLGSSANSTGSTSISYLSPASLISLVPPGLLIVSVRPGPLSSQNVANEQVSYYSKLTGEHFSMIADLVNFSLGSSPLGGLTNHTSGNSSSSSSSGSELFIYGTNSPAENAAATLANTYLPSLHPDGLIEELSNQLASGSLFTSTEYGYDSGVMAIGFARSLNNLTGGSNASPGSLFTLPGGNVSFCLGLFYRSDFAFGPGMHAVQLSSFAGSAPISFSPTASISMLSLLSPTGYNDLSLSSFPSGFNGTVFTQNLQAANKTASSPGWTFINESGRSQLSPDTILNFSSPLPPHVVISSSSAASGHTISVNAVVKNLGNSTVDGLSVHFPGISEVQTSLYTLPAGAAYRNQSTLSPGQSFDAQFLINASNPGTYVLPQLLYSYTYGGHAYNLLSSVMQVSVGRTSLFEMFPVYIASAFYLIASHLSAGLTFATILTLSYVMLTLFMGLAVYSEHSSFRKWKMRRPHAPRK